MCDTLIHGHVACHMHKVRLAAMLQSMFGPVPGVHCWQRGTASQLQQEQHQQEQHPSCVPTSCCANSSCCCNALTLLLSSAMLACCAALAGALVCAASLAVSSLFSLSRTEMRLRRFVLLPACRARAEAGVGVGAGQGLQGMGAVVSL